MQKNPKNIKNHVVYLLKLSTSSSTSPRMSSQRYKVLVTEAADHLNQSEILSFDMFHIFTATLFLLFLSLVRLKAYEVRVSDNIQ